VVAPPPTVLDALKRRVAASHEPDSKGRIQGIETLFTFRTTAQQVENTLYDWLEVAALSPARFQILMVLWALDGEPVPYQEIIGALRIKRATLSGLMAALERDGLVASSADAKDRRKLLARLTRKGKVMVTSTLDVNVQRVETAFSQLTNAEMVMLTNLLLRVREGFEQGAGRESIENG
jgi:DNA-binding MarR family transcriptional regulator